MANNISHFAIHADDVARAQRFYSAVFGWRFEAWGPPGFFRILTGTDADPGLPGALHQRAEPAAGRGMTGYECTIGVADLDPIRAAVVANGGKVLIDRSAIPAVGELLQFEDTEGNIVCAMRYEPGHP